MIVAAQVNTENTDNMVKNDQKSMLLRGKKPSNGLRYDELI